MSVQELLQRVVAMGFEEVTTQYNAVNQTGWRFVFAGPIPECCCEDEEALLWLFVFLKHTLGLREKSTTSH
jgi:hypothetical protein